MAPLLRWQQVFGLGLSRDGVNTKSLPLPRHGHRAVALKDLLVIFGGGNEGIFDELYVFNVVNNQWFMPGVKGDIPRGYAAYGFAADDTRVLMFGGMMEYGKYSNDLYELQAKRWEWKQLRPRVLRNLKPPCPRLGHSFTFVGDRVYLFGGLANASGDPRSNVPKYLNDLYTLDRVNNSVVWDMPSTFGPRPDPRESHTAVAHVNKESGKSHLIVYGGMNGTRLGDLWMLDCDTMAWSKPVVGGLQPVPRSLHCAAVARGYMYVFGGWVARVPGDDDCSAYDWKCTGELIRLDLAALEWEAVALDVGDGMPPPRAGTFLVDVDSRLYMWSGRDGYNQALDKQVCLDDMWSLEVDVPPPPGRAQLLHTGDDYLKLSWPSSGLTVKHYILEVMLYTHPPTSNTPFNSPVHYAFTSPQTLPSSVANTPTTNVTPTLKETEHKVERAVEGGGEERLDTSGNVEGSQGIEDASTVHVPPPEKLHGIVALPSRPVLHPLPSSQFRMLAARHHVSPGPRWGGVPTAPPVTRLSLSQAKTVIARYGAAHLMSARATRHGAITTVRLTSRADVVRWVAPRPPFCGGTVAEQSGGVPNVTSASVAPSTVPRMKPGTRVVVLNAPGSHVDKTPPARAVKPMVVHVKAVAEGKQMVKLLPAPASKGFINKGILPADPALPRVVVVPRQQIKTQASLTEGTSEESVPAAEIDGGIVPPLDTAPKPPLDPPPVRRSDTFVATSIQAPPLKTYGSKMALAAVDTPTIVNGVKSVPIAVPSPTVANGVKSVNVVKAVPAAVPWPSLRNSVKTVNVVKTVSSAVPSPVIANGVKSVPSATMANGVKSVPSPIIANGVKSVNVVKSVPASVPWPTLANGVKSVPSPPIAKEVKVTTAPVFTDSIYNDLPNESVVAEEAVAPDPPAVPLPAAPHSIRVWQCGDGAQLTWEARDGDCPTEFSVFMAVRSFSSSVADASHLAFVRVYVGPVPRCDVPRATLRNAHIDTRMRPSVIFRIAVRNAAGYGPATQVKWLQKAEGDKEK